jgi:hypothetical protein
MPLVSIGSGLLTGAGRPARPWLRMSPFRQLTRPRLMIATYILTLCMVVQTNGQSLDIPCDQRASAQRAGEFGYRLWTQSRHCEGFYDPQKNSQLEIVSYTWGRVEVQSTASTVSVQVPKTPILNARILNVRGSVPGYPLSYQLDVALRPGDTFNWPLNLVVRPSHLSMSRLSMLAFTGSPIDRLYVPVSIGPASSSEQQPLILGLRVADYCELLQMNVITGASQAATASGWTEVARYITAGATVPVPVPPGNDAVVKIVFRAQVIDGNPSVLSANILRLARF